MYSEPGRSIVAIADFIKWSRKSFNKMKNDRVRRKGKSHEVVVTVTKIYEKDGVEVTEEWDEIRTTTSKTNNITE